MILVPVISLLENSLLELKSVASSDKREVNAKDVEMATILPNSISRALLYNLKKYTNTISTLLVGVIGSAIYCFISVSLKQISCDAPRPWGINFQDSATPQMEGLVELHDNILFYLAIILFSVGWMLWSIVRTFVNTKSPISYKYVSHGTLIELIWTISPAIFLILIAFPSFKLLYLMDEVSDPAMALLAEGHQWYWSYQYPDFLNSEDEFIEFDSYLVPESDLEDGALRMLEVDNRVVLPETTHVRFIVTGGDELRAFSKYLLTSIHYQIPGTP